VVELVAHPQKRSTVIPDVGIVENKIIDIISVELDGVPLGIGNIGIVELQVGDTGICIEFDGASLLVPDIITGSAIRDRILIDPDGSLRIVESKSGEVIGKTDSGSCYSVFKDTVVDLVAIAAEDRRAACPPVVFHRIVMKNVIDTGLINAIGIIRPYGHRVIAIIAEATIQNGRVGSSLAKIHPICVVIANTAIRDSKILRDIHRIGRVVTGDPEAALEVFFPYVMDL